MKFLNFQNRKNFEGKFRKILIFHSGKWLKNRQLTLTPSPSPSGRGEQNHPVAKGGNVRQGFCANSAKWRKWRRKRQKQIAKNSLFSLFGGKGGNSRRKFFKFVKFTTDKIAFCARWRRRRWGLPPLMLREKLAAEAGGLERCAPGVGIPDRCIVEQKSYEVKLGFANGGEDLRLSRQRLKPSG
jgi:hypothetical protein